MTASGFCGERQQETDREPDTRFVDMEEYLSLLVSWRPLERLTDPAGNVLGLVDRQSGTKYLIEQEKLVLL